MRMPICRCRSSEAAALVLQASEGHKSPENCQGSRLGRTPRLGDRDGMRNKGVKQHEAPRPMTASISVCGCEVLRPPAPLLFFLLLLFFSPIDMIDSCDRVAYASTSLCSC